ncbi:hypothetical protein [Streptomyces sp. NPDC048644]|uniref:hypothetical protein n=1 Tax=Streptomyces sp. NPDC048644 TaxID=3365582 RepID=UPI0037115C3A
MSAMLPPVEPSVGCLLPLPEPVLVPETPVILSTDHHYESVLAPRTTGEQWLEVFPGSTHWYT